MDDGSSAPPNPLQAWLEATGGAERRPRDEQRAGGAPVRLLVVTAAVVAVCVGLAIATAAPRTGLPAGAAVVSEVPAAAVPPPAAAPSSPVAPTANPSVLTPQLAAAAVLAVRSATAPDTYVDTAVADSVVSHQAFSVVTVRAWVLSRTGEAWDAGAGARFAVAVDPAASPPTALGPPWLLAPPVTEPPPRRWRVVDDVHVDSVAAQTLRRAGYRGLRDLEVRSDATLPGALTVAVTATGPEQPSPQRHEVWVTPDAGAVLGAPTAAPVPIPGEQP